MAALLKKPMEVLVVPRASAALEAEKQLLKWLRELVRSAHRYWRSLESVANRVWNLMFYARVVRQRGPGEQPEELERLKGRYPQAGGWF